MPTSIATSAGPRILRHSSWDALLVSLSVAHAIVLFLRPPLVVVAICLWWNANTIAHNFIHLPFFRSRRLNRAYALWLSAVQGIPQSLWRTRHLRHHAHPDATDHPGRNDERPIPWTRDMTIEAATIGAAWTAMACLAPMWFALVYGPGYVAGLGFCWLQGHFEHARGTTSYYGSIYNLLFFNDGYHVEHHERPTQHWTRIRGSAAEMTSEFILGGPRDQRSSRWPPVLRWMETFTPRAVVTAGLNALEHVVLRSPLLQRFVLARHERACRTLLRGAEHVRRVTIVGGGLFPRTPLVIARVLPDAEITIVDASARHIDIARRFLDGRVRCACGTYDPQAPSDADLVVIPLAYTGDRRRLYEHPPAPAMLVHDWIWSTHDTSVVISWLLLKRLTLVRV